MSRYIFFVALVLALGCQENKPPTQGGSKAIEVKTTTAGTVQPQ
jgi:hypothetical protein